MNEYDFTLKFRLPSGGTDPEVYLGKLMDEGCDDALVGIGKTGHIALNFIREASSAKEAVFSAIENVKSAIPEANLIEATPDLVGVSDIADILECSRQNVRKLILKEGALFPSPTYEGTSSIWHLASVLKYLSKKVQYKIEKSLIELATISMTLNVHRQKSEIDPKMDQQVSALLN